MNCTRTRMTIRGWSLCLLAVLICPAAASAQSDTCWKTWIDSDSNNIMFNRMTAQLQTIGHTKGVEILKYAGSGIWTVTNDVVMYGNVIYTMNLHGLEVYDATNPASLVRVKQIYLGLGSETDRLRLYDHYLYVGMYGQLHIFDIADPLNPQQVSVTTLPGHIMEIIVKETRLYVGMVRYSNESTNYPILYIFDNTNPASLQTISKYEPSVSSNDCRCFVIIGDYIYAISHWTSILDVISIVDETHPVRVTAKALNYPYDIAASGQYLFLANRDTLRAYDVSDPDSLVLVRARYCSPTPEVVEVHNGLIYTAHGYNDDYGITVFNFTPGGGFDSVGHYDSWLNATTINFKDTLALFAEYLTGFSVINVARPAQMKLVSSVLHDCSVMRGLDVDGDYAYMTNYMSYSGQRSLNGLLIADISDKQNPELVSFTSASGNPLQVAVYDTLAFLSECQPTFIYSVADKAHPVKLSQFPETTWIQTKDNAARDTFLFVASPTKCLWTASIADPVHPRVLTTLDTSYGRYGFDILLSGNIAFVMATNSGIDACYVRSVDITNPAAPRQLGEVQLVDNVWWPYPGTPHRRGDILYVGAGQGGLFAVDISNPSLMEVIGKYQRYENDP
jgi:hypothetical protein